MQTATARNLRKLGGGVEHLFKSTLALCCLTLGAMALPAQAEEEGAARRVDVNEYFVRGNTVLDAAAIEEAVYPFLGPQKTLGDIEGARDALQKIYQALIGVRQA